MKRDISMGDKYTPAMAITDQAEADKVFEQLVQDSMSYGHSREDSEAIERGNLGYFAGYFGNETRERVERLFKCEHPIFGSIVKNGPPTLREALLAGMAIGKGATVEDTRKVFS